MKNQTRSRIFFIAECGLMIALATVLSMIKIYHAPYGGSVTLVSALPILLVAMRRGTGAGLTAGFVFSVIQLLLGLDNVAWVPTASGIILCCLLDYILPFTLYGLCGAFRKVKIVSNETANRLVTFVIGTVFVMAIRYACHVVSGVVVWYSLDLMWYADEPTHIVNMYGPWLFSIIYNATFMVPEIIVTALGAAAISPVKSLFKTKE